MKITRQFPRGRYFLFVALYLFSLLVSGQSSVFNSELVLKNPTVCQETNARLEIWIKPGLVYVLEKLVASGDWVDTGLHGTSHIDYWASFEVKALLEPIEYRVKVFESTQNVVFSNVVKVVGQRPSWVTQPGGARVCSGDDATFQGQVNEAVGTFQWMKKVNNTFTALTESTKFKGVTSSQLTIKKTINGDDATSYILIFKNVNGCEVVSDEIELRINQSGTIRPTASQTVCEAGNLKLETTNYKGIWKRTEWAIRDTLGVYKPILDSLNDVLFLSNVPLNQTHYRAEPFFEKFEITRGDTVKGECGIKIYRNFTITAQPLQPDSLSIQERCGAGSLVIHGLPNKLYSWFDSLGQKIADKTNSLSLVLSKPDSSLYSYAEVNEKGCLSKSRAFQVVQHPVVEISFSSPPDICPSDSLFDLSLLHSLSNRIQVSLWSVEDSSSIGGLLTPTKIHFPATFFEVGERTYTLYAIDSLTKCESKDLHVSIRKQPKQEPFSYIENMSICLGQSVLLQNGLPTDFRRLFNHYVLFNEQKMGEDSVSFLKIDDFRDKHVGNYQFVSENSCERHVSNPFQLSVQEAAVFLPPQFPNTICRNEPVHLSVMVNDLDLMAAFEWKVNENILSQTGTNCVISTELYADLQVITVDVRGITMCGDTIYLGERYIQLVDVPNMTVLDSSLFAFCTSSVTQTIVWPFGGATSSSWFSDSLTTENLGSTLLFTPNKVGKHTFFVQGTNERGCTSSRTPIDIYVGESFNLSIAATNDFICTTGELNKKVVLSAIAQTTNTINYQWFTSQGDSISQLKSIVVDTPQQYDLVAQSGACRVKKSIEIVAQQSEVVMDILPDSYFLCADSLLIYGLRSQPFIQNDWYLSATSPNPFYSGDTLRMMAPLDSFTVFIAAHEGNKTQSCETNRQKVVFVQRAQFNVLTPLQQKCRGNVVNFEVRWTKMPTENGMVQWQRKRPDETVFTDMIGETNLTLTVRTIGNSTNPSGTKYQLLWKSQTCEIKSDEMILLVNQFTETLASQVICEHSFFELKSPNSIGDIRESTWQYRATTSGSWQVLPFLPSFSSFPDSLNGFYFRNRVVFATSDGGSCTITSDDGRVQLQRIAKEWKEIATDCGQPVLEMLNKGAVPLTIYLNGEKVNQTPFKLPSGIHTLSVETPLGCRQDTSWLVDTFTRPAVPINQTPEVAFTKDSLVLRAIGTGEIGWFLDSLYMNRYDSSIPLTHVGRYNFYLAQRTEDCWSHWERVQIDIHQSLIIETEPVSFGTCEGRSARLTVKAKGKGLVRYQWQMSSNGLTNFKDIDSSAHFADGASTAELRWRSVGSSHFPDITYFRCLVYDEIDTLTSQTVYLQPYSLRGALLPNVTVCQGEDLAISIHSFRSITGPIAQMGWQKNSPDGWGFISEEIVQEQLLFNAVTTNQEGSYRFSAVFELKDGTACIRNSDTFTLKVGSIPEPPVVSIPSFCQEEKVISLARLPGITSRIRWYRQESNLDNPITNPLLDLSVPQSMAWYITEVNTDKCQSLPTELKLQIHPKPELPISTTPNPLLIQGETFLSANGENLKWYRTKTIKEYSFSPPQFTKKGKASYYVTSTNQFGCESERLLIQTELVNSLVIDRQPLTMFECEGNVASFSVRATSYLPISYVWYQQKNDKEDFQVLPSMTGNTLRIDSSGSRFFPDSSRYVCLIADAEGSILSDTVQLFVNKLHPIPALTVYCLSDSIALTTLQVGAQGKVKIANWEARSQGKWVRFFEGQHLPTHRIIDSLGNEWRVNFQFESEGNATCSRTTRVFTVSPSACFYAQDSLENRCIQATHRTDALSSKPWIRDSLNQVWGHYFTNTSLVNKPFLLEREEFTAIEENWFPALFTLRNMDSIRVDLFLTSHFQNINMLKSRWYQAIREENTSSCGGLDESVFALQPDSIHSVLRYGERLLQVPLYENKSVMFFRGELPKLRSFTGSELADSTYILIKWDVDKLANIRYFTLEKWIDKEAGWVEMAQTNNEETYIKREFIEDTSVWRLRGWLSDFAYVELANEKLSPRLVKPFCLASPNPISEAGLVRLQSSLDGPISVFLVDMFGRRRNVGVYSSVSRSVDVTLPNTAGMSFTLKWTGGDGRTCEQKMARQ